MKRTRFFTLLLALLLCVSVLCMTAYAESDAWDGRTSEAFADGDGSESNPYQIANGAQLYYLTLQSDTNHYYASAEPRRRLKSFRIHRLTLFAKMRFLLPVLLPVLTTR